MKCCQTGRLGFHLWFLGWTAMPHRLAAFCPAFTSPDLSHGRALNSDPLFHQKRNRNMNIPLQSLNYFFLEQKSERIHQWSSETLKTGLGREIPAFPYQVPAAGVGKTDRLQVPWNWHDNCLAFVPLGTEYCCLLREAEGFQRLPAVLWILRSLNLCNRRG